MMIISYDNKLKKNCDTKKFIWIPNRRPHKKKEIEKDT